MFKKSILTLILVLAACLGAAPAVMAQASVDTAMFEAVFAKEPPITQTDIDNFIKITPYMTQNASVNDIAKIMEIFEQAGWTEIRASYVSAKTINAYAINKDPEARSLMESAGIPSILMPTDAEMALVLKNFETLDKALSHLK